MKGGFFTTGEVAEMVGIPYQTLIYWVKTGKVNNSLVSKAGYRFWSPADIEKVRLYAKPDFKGPDDA